MDCIRTSHHIECNEKNQRLSRCRGCKYYRDINTGVLISQVDFVYLLSQLDYLRILLREDNFKSYTRQGIEKSVIVLQREMEKYADQTIQPDIEEVVMDGQQKELAYRMAEAFIKTETCDEAITMVSNGVNDTKFNNLLRGMWLAIYAYIESEPTGTITYHKED